MPLKESEFCLLAYSNAISCCALQGQTRLITESTMLKDSSSTAQVNHAPVRRRIPHAPARRHVSRHFRGSGTKSGPRASKDAFTLACAFVCDFVPLHNLKPFRSCDNTAKSQQWDWTPGPRWAKESPVVCQATSAERSGQGATFCGVASSQGVA